MAPGDEISSSGGKMTYVVDIHTLIHQTVNHPTQSIRVSDLPIEWMTQKCWTNMEGPNVPRPAPDLFSPQELLDDPSKSPQHWKQLQECDMSYPILLTNAPDGSWNMVNGKHRYIKSVLEKSEFVIARIVSLEDLDAAKWDDAE
ncbi:hypothetical protein HDU99_008031 [Rhizoclosmatium hyalinum]|nr:hypothetical protein HDU99_008031 [Rhizoclosmatium hyalinum]